MQIAVLLEVMAVVVNVLVVVVVVVVVKVVGLPRQIRPDEPSNISSLSAAEVSHAPQSDCAKDDAPENIFRMFVTLETSHV